MKVRCMGAALACVSLALPLGAQTIAITGGKVYPVSGAPIENGTVLVRDGKIVAVGANVAVPADAQRIDARGKWVTPGFVNGATQLGLSEISTVAETNAGYARGKEGVAAAFIASDGLDPQSVLIKPARQDGITTVAILPAGGLIAGQAGVIDLVDGSATDLIRRRNAVMVAQLDNPQAAGLGSRGEVILRLREILDDTKAYMRRKAAFETADIRQLAISRSDLEAMIPVVEGRMPLLLQIDKASDIETALRLAKEYGLKIIIGNGAEAWEVADKLAAARVPVLTGAMSNIPGSFATLGTRQENAGLLRRAGVSVGIIGNSGGGDEGTFNVRNVRYEAGNAVAYGMSWDDALRAVTLVPAEVFGVADRVGTLQPGRDANIVVWNGDPFEFATRAEHVMIRGREFTGPTRQDLLTERYKTLPPTYTKP